MSAKRDSSASERLRKPDCLSALAEHSHPYIVWAQAFSGVVTSGLSRCTPRNSTGLPAGLIARPQG